MCICKVCGKHYMMSRAGNLKDYVHYDYSALCKGGYNELVSGPDSNVRRDSVLGEHRSGYPISTGATYGIRVSSM